MIYNLDEIDLENTCRDLEIFQDDYRYKVVPIIRTAYVVEGEETEIQGLGKGKEVLAECSSYILLSHGQLYKIEVVCDCESETVRYSADKIDKIDLEDLKGIKEIKSPDKEVVITVNDVMDMFCDGWDWADENMEPVDENLFPFLMNMRSYLSNELADKVVGESIKKLNGNVVIKNVDLADRMEHLNYLIDEDNEQQILSMIETIIDKFSPKDVLQHAVYTATRNVENVMASLDALITYTDDENAVEELFAHLDTAITNIELTEESKRYDELTKEHKKSGGKGHIKQVKRGEVYWCTLTMGVGHEMSGERTVLVISNDLQNKHGATVNVLAMDGDFLSSDYHEEIKICDLQSGDLPGGRTSVAVAVTSILTIDKSRLDKKQCRVKYNKMKDINVRLFKQLGLSINSLMDNSGRFRV